MNDTQSSPDYNAFVEKVLELRMLMHALEPPHTRAMSLAHTKLDECHLWVKHNLDRGAPSDA